MNTRTRSTIGIALVLIAILAGLASCATNNTPHRTTYLDGDLERPVAAEPSDKAASARMVSLIKAGDDQSNAVRLAFFEFDDQGYLYRDKYKDSILKVMAEKADSAPQLIIVFAHGWKHNAGSTDANVESFREFLLSAAKIDKDACRSSDCKAREVLGVYLGWRGLSKTHEPFELLSFWERKSRAHRVGIDGATEIIAELGAIKANANSKLPRPQTRLVLAGHSFGAALMYSATQQMLMRDTYFPDAEAGVLGSTADLIILVNPAFEASRFHALRLRGVKLGKQDTYPHEQQRPILVLFSSAGDSATAMFHFGRGLSTFLMPQSRFEAEDDGTSMRNQRAENVIAVGQHDPWVTHLLKLSNGEQQQSLTEIACGWHAFQYHQSKEWRAGASTLIRAEKLPRDQWLNPYMLVRVDSEIIKDHGDIWTAEFSRFLYNMIAALNVPDGQLCHGR